MSMEDRFERVDFDLISRTYAINHFQNLKHLQKTVSGISGLYEEKEKSTMRPKKRDLQMIAVPVAMDTARRANAV